MSEPLRTLILEDRASDAALVVRELERAGFDPTWKRVETEQQYVTQLEALPEIILADYTIPEFGAMRALEVLQETGLDIPFIIVSGSIGEDIAVEAMRLGAADYLLKDRLGRLGPAVNNALAQTRSRKEGKQAAEELRSTHEQLHHLLAHSPAVIYSLKIEDQRVTPTLVSDNIERLLGVRVEAATYEWWVESLHPDDRERALKTLNESLSGDGYSMEYRIRHKNGSYHRVQDDNRVVRDAFGKATESVGVWMDITERKQAEDALNTLRRQQELILNSVGDGIYGIDLAGNINFVNPKAAQLLGWSVSELLGKPVHATVHHTHADGNKYPIESCPIYLSMRDGATRRVTNDAFWRKDGSSFRVDYVASAISNENGRIAGSIVTFKDITEQFAAEMRLKLQEQQYRLLFETNPNPMWVFETKTLQILAVNRAAITQYGYSRDEFLGLTLQHLRPDEDRANLMEALASPRSPAHFSGEFRHKRKNGSLIFVEIYSGPILWEDVAARITTAIDVTERKQAHDQLRKQAKLLDLAQDAIMVRDMEDRIEFWNHGAEKLYGWTAAEVQGKKASSFLYQDEPDAAATARAAVIEDGNWTGECKHTCQDGGTITVRSRWTLVRDELAVPKSILIINTDVTEQKKLETHLLRAQRLESIGTLASGVAHDLNNILTPILMSAEVLKGNPMQEDFPALVAMIDESAKRGANVVKQVLTFARGIEGESVVITPTHLIQEMIDIAKKTFPKTIEIIGRYTDDLWSIKCDPTQLHQVLLNLSVNARDAMPNGGTITIGAENFNVDEHYASMSPDAKPGPHVMFRVTDTGAGMSRATIDKIFDPFFTTKQIGKGTGLGLSTALGIVKSHGGFISVYSELETGTTFKVLLPAQVGEEASSQKSPASPESLKGNGELILVVDDEAGILRITKMILEKHNYRFLPANDGTEALAAFAQQMGSISVVLTDIMMPYVDGVALIRAMKKMKPEMLFIASTGQGADTRVAELESLGVGNFLTKPYDTAKLLKTLRDALSVRSDPVALN
jgi:PAS domain S-box-containing protein